MSDIAVKLEVVADFTKKYLKRLYDLLENLSTQEVFGVVEAFAQARNNGKTIFFVGNGGSAATASHFSQDLAEVGRKAKSPLFRTLSLTDNTAYITAMGNDYGFETVFSKQIEQMFKEGDVLVAISASGNSKNLIRAAEAAKALRGTTIGIVGFDGGELKRICDKVIHVKSEKGEYGPVEDVHMILDHLTTCYLMGHLSAKPA
jgi:D-sedoheptulose 7-phosphate isomerase